jgi:tRNA(fMet)-specific endonuclease VapC
MKVNGKFLLDTSVVIANLRRETIIQERLTQIREIYIPIIVLGELYFGANRSNRKMENLASINEFAASVSILDCDRNTAYRYAYIKDQLCKVGKPIPDNDIWIAAIAKQYDLILATRDNHFINLDDLIELEIW